MKSTNENRFSRAKVELMVVPEFALISGLVAAMPIAIKDDMPTAATDGLRVWFGQDFLDSLSPKQLNYVLAHEYMHAVFQHCRSGVFLGKKYSRQVVAQSVDYMVNLVVEECGGRVVERPDKPIPLVDARFEDMSVAEICSVLEGENADQPTLDIHMEAGEGKAGEDPSAAEQALVEAIEKAISLGIQRDKDFREGKESRAMALATKMLNRAPPWQNYVQAFIAQSFSGIGDESTWRRPNRRMIGQGVYLPSLVTSTLPEVVLNIDVSGSMSEDDISNALADVRSLCAVYRIEKLHVVYWDVGVTKHEIFRDTTSEADVQDLTPIGGGGTAFAPVLEYLKENGVSPAFMVGWTDGYLSEWGAAPTFPVMWVMTTNQVPPWGQVINFSGSDI